MHHEPLILQASMHIQIYICKSALLFAQSRKITEQKSHIKDGNK